MIANIAPINALYTGVDSGCRACGSWSHCHASPTLDSCAGEEITERIQKSRKHSLKHYYNKNWQAKTCGVCGQNRINARATMCKSCAARQREARKKVTDAA